MARIPFVNRNFGCGSEAGNMPPKIADALGDPAVWGESLADESSLAKLPGAGDSAAAVSHDSSSTFMDLSTAGTAALDFQLDLSQLSLKAAEICTGRWRMAPGPRHLCSAAMGCHQPACGPRIRLPRYAAFDSLFGPISPQLTLLRNQAGRGAEPGQPGEGHKGLRRLPFESRKSFQPDPHAADPSKGYRTPL